MAMRFQIKKLLEGYDPADLIEQSMYCFGSDSSDSDDGTADQDETAGMGSTNSQSMGMDSSVSDQANAQAGSASGVSGQENSQGSIGIDAFGGRGGAYSTQSTAGMQSSAGDMRGGSMSITDPTTGQTTTYSPTQVPALEMMKSVPYDIFNIVDKVNKTIRDRDRQGFYTQVTRDEKGNVTGAFDTNNVLGFDVNTYTGFDQNPYNEDMSMSGGESETIKPATINPVSGQPVCPDGYRYDDDLQACRLDTSRPNRPNNPNPFPSGDAYYRATSLDQAPMNLPSGFDFNNANQNFVSQFAYRPANFTNQMGLSGFTPFRRS
jgi:YD repeat-containing protein